MIGLLTQCTNYPISYCYSIRGRGGGGDGLELLRKGGGWVEGALEIQRKGALELQQALY